MIIQFLIYHIAQSIINNHLSLIFLLHVSTSIRSSSGVYTKAYKYTHGVAVYSSVELSAAEWPAQGDC